MVNKEWKQFNHFPGLEYLSLPMAHTCDLEQSFNLQVPFFGRKMNSWIHDIVPYHEFSVTYIFRCKYIVDISTKVCSSFCMNNLTSYIIS